MTAGRLPVVFLALVVAGTGFMLAVLPRSERLPDPTGALPEAVTIACDSPVVDAFREPGDPPGGWFAYAPNTGVLFNDSGWCVNESRRRLSWGTALLIAGSAVGFTARRQVAGPSEP